MTIEASDKTTQLGLANWGPRRLNVTSTPEGELLAFHGRECAASGFGSPLEFVFSFVQQPHKYRSCNYSKQARVRIFHTQLPSWCLRCDLFTVAY